MPAQVCRKQLIGSRREQMIGSRRKLLIGSRRKQLCGWSKASCASHACVSEITQDSGDFAAGDYVMMRDADEACEQKSHRWSWHHKREAASGECLHVCVAYSLFLFSFSSFSLRIAFFFSSYSPLISLISSTQAAVDVPAGGDPDTVQHMYVASIEARDKETIESINQNAKSAAASAAAASQGTTEKLATVSGPARPPDIPRPGTRMGGSLVPPRPEG